MINVDSHAAHCRMASTTITIRVIKGKIEELNTKCEYTPGLEMSGRARYDEATAYIDGESIGYMVSFFSIISELAFLNHGFL